MTAPPIQSPLPIDQALPDLLQVLRSQTRCVLHAPPGAGKTTRVPLALLPLLAPPAGRIVLLEPRRLAAVSAARYMADLLGEPVGQTVGYSIRFDSRVSAATRIEVVTEGILTRRIQHDPLLEGVGLVIFDEFHERSIQADLGLALCLDVQRQVRDDLRILVMSATLDCQPLAALLEAPVVSSSGRSFPVEEIYCEDQPGGQLPQRVASVVLRALAETTGDLLVFLPGAGEIRACIARLVEADLPARGIALHPLYGDLPFEEQQAAIRPGQQRKVVLATDIAETSLTIEGIRTVIDCGLSRRMRYDPASGMNRLVTVRESKASAEQRKGRGGRLSAGVCYRLFSRHTYSAMTPHAPAEMLEADLAALVLELAAWGVSDPATLSWLDPPPAAALSSARSLLALLGALDTAGRITPTGSIMAGIPLHPRLARLLLHARELDCPALGCDLAALLSERDIIRRGAGGGGFSISCDVGDRVELLREWRATGRAPEADLSALQAVDRVSRQLLRLALFRGAKGGAAGSPDLIARLLLVAYPDRLAKLRDTSDDRYLIANGRGARLRAARTTVPEPFLVAVSLGGGEQSEGVIHLAAAVSENLLRTELEKAIVRRERVEWDSREGRVKATREECLGALVLSARAVAPSDGEAVPVLLEAVRASGLALLRPGEAFHQVQARVMLLHRAFPEEGWPDFSQGVLMEHLEAWLAPALAGVRTAQQLAGVDAAAALLMCLEYRQRRALDELAPTHLVVPSGSRIRLDYCSGDLPVLAVKLQEMFGLADTPTVAAGRVPVLLHLLSPAGRPLQVTRDLRGFWNAGYHEVRRHMKGRYPKHPWPDDPWSAAPTGRAKPRLPSR